MLLRGLLIVLLVQLLGCERAPAEAKAEVQTEAVSNLRDEARMLLEAHCGECHISGYPTARAEALRIFDLTETDWSARMTNAQLRNALWRLGEPLDEHAKPRNVPESDQGLFKKFVDAEIQRRQVHDGRRR